MFVRGMEKSLSFHLSDPIFLTSSYFLARRGLIQVRKMGVRKMKGAGRLIVKRRLRLFNRRFQWHPPLWRTTARQ
jgi:hypothetical protein